MFNFIKMNLNVSLKKIKTKKYKVNFVSKPIKKQIKKIKINNWIDNLESDYLIDNNLILIAKGKFSNVYQTNSSDKSNSSVQSNGSDQSVIKISYILKKINDLILNGNISEQSACNYIEEFENELTQNENFSKLSHIIPNNIIKIYYTHRLFVGNDLIPVNVICMEKVNGTTLFNQIDQLIKSENIQSLFNLIINCIKLFLNINLIGYFHNDINLTNILVENDQPKLIDYSFSKILNKINLFPVECVIFICQLNNFFQNNIYIRQNENIKNMLIKFENIKNTFVSLELKYDIHCTNFIEKIITGIGIFKQHDYNQLPTISNVDITKIHNILSHTTE